MSEKSYFHGLGVKLEKLGKALQDPESSISDIASLAHDAGLRIEFRMTVPDDGDAVQEAG